MPYHVFLRTIREQLQTQLGENYQLSLCTLPKNNGVLSEGLIIRAHGSKLAPVISLKPYYEQYQRGTPLAQILSNFQEFLHSFPVISLSEESLLDFSSIRDRILFRLIHSQSNQELLASHPNIPYLDMSIIFYLFLEQNETGQTSALITWEHADHWGVSPKQLWELALYNTPRLLPATISSLSGLVRSIALGEPCDIPLELPNEESSPLYVLSNSSGLYGAACILYPDIIKDFANMLGKDLVILPSSIHEVLLAADIPDISYEELSDIVTQINYHEVSLTDQLSNQVYLYRRAAGQIQIVSSAPALLSSDSET